MNDRVAPVLLSGFLVVLGLGANGAVAQETSDGAPGTVLAQFDDARALAVDPRGRLYVADAGPDVVAVVGAKGTRLRVIGGTGTRAGEFDTPSDVDPTNGQMLLVADTYNGRVQRFSEEGQFLGALPIGAGGGTEGEGWVFAEEGHGAAVQGRGRPVAVVHGSEGTIFVLDVREEALFKWTGLGRPERIAGGLAQRGDRLQEPIGLALSDTRRLYVADAGREAVLVYDSFGTFMRTLSTPPLPNLRSVTVHRGRLWIVCAERIFVWEPSTRQVTRREVTLSEPLVDVALYEDEVYLLTATRLLRRDTW